MVYVVYVSLNSDTKLYESTNWLLTVDNFLCVLECGMLLRQMLVLTAYLAQNIEQNTVSK